MYLKARITHNENVKLKKTKQIHDCKHDDYKRQRERERDRERQEENGVGERDVADLAMKCK